ncbi:hypothetical protein ACT3SZ_15570 [Corynebacterium sp. AOP40-9SA-29]|uniref:hypothetical protein n=1 Tax=Corynebacterium sp. AOP40-9SA-29 TaxID=3457677 RepID=UPI0040346B29
MNPTPDSLAARSAEEYREYLTAIADGITAVTDPARRQPRASDLTSLFSAAGLIRWSGAPKNSGWAATASGRQIVNRCRRRA